MRRHLLACLVLLGAAAMSPADDTLPLRLTDRDRHDVTLQPLDGGGWEIVTTGGDPYVFTEPLPAPVDRQRPHVLALEYFSTTGTDGFQAFLVPPLSEANSLKGPGLSRSEGWSHYTLDLTPALAKAPQPVTSLRLDFGNRPGKTIRLRAIRLRPPTEAERAFAARREARRAHDAALDAALRAYLAGSYPCQVEHVAVEAEQVRITGKVAGDRPCVLAEIPLWAELGDEQAVASRTPVVPGADGRFALSLPRRPSAAHDRLLARWALARSGGDKPQWLSHARYADEVASAHNPRRVKPRHKKGLGGYHAGRCDSDLDDLDIAAVTVNLVLSGLFSTTGGAGWSPFEYAGRTWYVDDKALAGFDRTFGEAAKRNIAVSVILLIAQPGRAPAGSYARLLAHPDADPAGIFPMPDVASAQGLTAYCAGLDFLCRRYGRPDGQHGRIHHWILHNEVNSGWVWTNAGEKTDVLYLDLYQKSMRAAWLSARQYDPHAQPFISLEHHWTMRTDPRCHPGRDLLELLVRFSAAEGDFDWGLAYHPYPQNLFEPRVWLDREATFTNDTRKITFRNLEVLDAWVRDRAHWFRGERPRVVHLSEQGLNSRDYSPAALRDQAAGMAYAWQKVKALATIEAFQYHNWIDNRGEGGLRIGLRRFPDDRDEPLGRKPIWYVYQALGTPREAEATAFALPVIGIPSWDEVRAGR